MKLIFKTLMNGYIDHLSVFQEHEKTLLILFKLPLPPLRRLQKSFLWDFPGFEFMLPVSLQLNKIYTI